MADGSNRGGIRNISQVSKKRLDLFQFVCSLAGIRTCLRGKVIATGDYAGTQMWDLSLKEKEVNFVPKKDVRTTVKYTGTVWCPVTKNQTWFARRNGTVYFTGNTAYIYASLQPEFWLGFDDEKYLGFDDGQILFDTFAGVKRSAIWVNLNTGKEIDAGERDEKDFLRLYRCIEQVDKAMNAEVYVPNISGDSCNFCPYLEECCAVGPVADKIIKRSN
jgi:hypothetical protein